MPPKKKAKDSAPAWNEEHPARSLIWQEIYDGNIPVDENEMSAEEVWDVYKETHEFQMTGMAFNHHFKRRLSDMREQVRRHKSRAEDDQVALDALLRNHPPSDRDHRGRPHWNGSQAQSFLDQDLRDGVDETFENAREFWHSRSAYEEFDYVQFYKHIEQHIKTKKYLHTLRFKENAKKDKAYKKAMR